MRIDTPWFEVDASASPLVVTTIRDLDSSEAVRRLGEAYVQVFDKRVRQLFITDIGRPARFDVTIRHDIANMVSALRLHELAWSEGAVVIVRAPLIRATMMAIRWLARPAVPEWYVSSPAEAADLAATQMHELGMPVDEAVRARLGALRQSV